MLVGLVAAIVVGGGRVRAEIIMSEPTNLGPIINDSGGVQESDFSHDGLELYFSANRPGGYGGKDIWVAKRETLNSPWQEPVNLGPAVNSSSGDMEPSISGDSLELYFGYWNDYILRVCTRPSKDAPWSSPVKIGPPVGSTEPAIAIGSDDAWTPEISDDGLSLYFTSTRTVGGYGGNDIWVTTRATKDDPWDEPVNLGPNVNTPDDDWMPSISTDGLTLVFSRGTHSMCATTRKSTDDEWGPAVQLDFKNAPGRFHSPALSPDGSTLYFDATNQWGGYGGNDFWQVKFIPVVDFNGDGIVDSLDMCILVDNWHTNSTLCDIAPLPLGDGYVDVKDLVVLAGHLFEEFPPVQ
jgi:Tol biopolymer transport system component